MYIVLKINTPEKTYKPQKANKVVLPVKEGNLTIIKDRAPRSQILTEGMVMLLDEQNTILKKWHIGGGVAEIAEDVCQIAVENIEEI
jgi:F0F1-type ATP synthase epsilon subunit